MQNKTILPADTLARLQTVEGIFHATLDHDPASLWCCEGQQD
jgi:hypothetical protein